MKLVIVASGIAEKIHQVHCAINYDVIAPFPQLQPNGVTLNFENYLKLQAACHYTNRSRDKVAHGSVPRYDDESNPALWEKKMNISKFPGRKYIMCEWKREE